MTQETPSLEAQLEAVERHITDAAENVQRLLNETISFQAKVVECLNRTSELERKMRLLIPEVENCPKCHRKVNPGARSCPICSHRW